MNELERLTADVLHFRDERDWKQFHNPKDVALSLLLEAGEVLEIFQWKDAAGVAETAQARKDDLADELADVLCYTLLMAHDLGIDLSAALAAKLRKNALKYPVDKARGSSSKYTGL
ncbi:nucleotide pyrophosphohydrolase [Ramlibacter alkalitolerans]|uniref:Nucleotide pyrophosphohydrolase n=1 Tax=Ramlibacter alkalitolerans TaxID=2039631 RepID=A0ABS1JKS3_9BURK|nr:nucleotide pyrophosphohydrolase [Ramlibacter alkalitolerans]MBL0424818.1 nucleotide pyrophosphohydrolase [Ramlibacter alkalitolerans]